MTCCRTWLKNAPRDEKAYLSQKCLELLLLLRLSTALKQNLSGCFFRVCVCAFVRFLLVFFIINLLYHMPAAVGRPRRRFLEIHALQDAFTCCRRCRNYTFCKITL